MIKPSFWRVRASTVGSTSLLACFFLLDHFAASWGKTIQEVEPAANSVRPRDAIAKKKIFSQPLTPQSGRNSRISN